MGMPSLSPLSSLGWTELLREKNFQLSVEVLVLD